MARLDFQPMPKRFAVWDKQERKWVVTTKPTEYWPAYCNRCGRRLEKK